MLKLVQSITELSWQINLLPNLSTLLLNILFKGEYVRLAYRTYTPRPLRYFWTFHFQIRQKDKKADTSLFREVAGDVVLVTGAGHGMGR